MVECVEGFGANLQKLILTNLKFLGDRKVQVADIVTSDVREVPGCVAGNIVARITKTLLVQETEIAIRRGHLVVTQASREVRTENLRPGIAVLQQSGSVIN